MLFPKNCFSFLTALMVLSGSGLVACDNTTSNNTEAQQTTTAQCEDVSCTVENKFDIEKKPPQTILSSMMMLGVDLFANTFIEKTSEILAEYLNLKAIVYKAENSTTDASLSIDGGLNAYSPKYYYQDTSSVKQWSFLFRETLYTQMFSWHQKYHWDERGPYAKAIDELWAFDTAQYYSKFREIDDLFRALNNASHVEKENFIKSNMADRVSFALKRMKLIESDYNKVTKQTPDSELAYQATRNIKNQLRVGIAKHLAQPGVLNHFCDTKMNFIAQNIRKQDKRFPHLKLEILIEKSMMLVAKGIADFEKGNEHIDEYLNSDLSNKESASQAELKVIVALNIDPSQSETSRPFRLGFSNYAFFWRQRERGGDKLISATKSCLQGLLKELK